jgi:DNA uptake protein ComE-like DNA-binding protein
MKMKLFLKWQRLSAILLLVIFAVCAGCNQQPTPQEIREKTAKATEDAKRDAKAVAEGIRDGWNSEHPLDLNSSTKEQLSALPGVSSAEAARVIAGRPYQRPDDLVNRGIMSRSEYDKIADRVTVK